MFDLADACAGEIFASGEDADTTTMNWLGRYDEDNAAALMDLVNCVLKSAGCNFEVDIHDIGDPDNANSRLTDIQDSYNEVSCIG